MNKTLAISSGMILASLILIGAGCSQTSRSTTPAQPATELQVRTAETNAFTLKVDPKYNIVTSKDGTTMLGVSGNEAPSGTVYIENGKTLVVDDSFYIRWNLQDEPGEDLERDFNLYCKKDPSIKIIEATLGGRSVSYCSYGLFNAETYGGPAYFAPDANPPALIYIDADSKTSKNAITDAMSVLNTIVWK